MIKRIISAICSFSLIGICVAANEVEKVHELPDIVELRILDSRTIYMRSMGGFIRLSSEGGFVEDRHYIEAETGAIKPNPNARKPNEITITVGEQASNEIAYGGNTYKLFEIKGKAIRFHHTQALRNSKRLERDVIVSPYLAPTKSLPLKLPR